jgi:uncharacterized protein YqgV (UPF0045/DUF77 family)
MNEGIVGMPETQNAPIGLADTSVERYRPSRIECLRDYNINIKFLTLGCIIEVGCKSIPFTTIKEGMEALNQYIEKPYETRQIWDKRFQEEE